MQDLEKFAEFIRYAGKREQSPADKWIARPEVSEVLFEELVTEGGCSSQYHKPFRFVA